MWLGKQGRAGSCHSALPGLQAVPWILQSCPLPHPHPPPRHPSLPRQEMDKHHPLHREFWSAALLVAEHELYEQQKQEDLDRAK